MCYTPWSLLLQASSIMTGAAIHKPATAADKQRIAKALWVNGIPATFAQAKALAARPGTVAKCLGFTNHKVKRVRDNILKSFPHYYPYLLVDNTSKPPVSTAKYLSGDADMRALLQSMAEAQNTGCAWTDDDLLSHLRQLGALNGMASDPSKSTLLRYKAKLAAEFQVVTREAKRCDTVRTNVSYAACKKYLQAIQQYYRQYPNLQFDPDYQGNLDEQGSHGSSEKYAKPKVFLVPVDEHGKYSPTGEVPKNYMHNSHASGNKLTQCPLITASGKLVSLAFFVETSRGEASHLQPDWIARPRHPLLTDDFMDNIYIGTTTSGNATGDEFYNMIVEPTAGIIAKLRNFFAKLGKPLDAQHPFLLTLDFPKVHAMHWEKIEPVLRRSHIIPLQVPVNSTIDSNMLDNGFFAHFSTHRQKIMNAVVSCHANSTLCLDHEDPTKTVSCSSSLPIYERSLGLGVKLVNRTQILLHSMIWILLDDSFLSRRIARNAAAACGVSYPTLGLLKDWKCLREHWMAIAERKRKAADISLSEKAAEERAAVKERYMSKRVKRGNNYLALKSFCSDVMQAAAVAMQTETHNAFYSFKETVISRIATLGDSYFTPLKEVAGNWGKPTKDGRPREKQNKKMKLNSDGTRLRCMKDLAAAYVQAARDKAEGNTNVHAYRCAVAMPLAAGADAAAETILQNV